MNDLKCSFCFDILDNCDVAYADKCLCKVKYHTQCIKDLNDNGWDCPICIKKNNNYNHHNNTRNIQITNQNNVIVVIARLLKRATSYRNSGEQTKDTKKAEVCFRVANEMEDLANTLAESFDKPEMAILSEEYYKAVKNIKYS